MARYTDASCRLCRRKAKSFTSKERCTTNKCAISRRPYAPGQHGQVEKAVGVRFTAREKQKARRYYGVLESQFRKYLTWLLREKELLGKIYFKYLN